MTGQAPAIAVLEALPKAKAGQDGQWQACCPAHEDSSPSFGWRISDDGTVLLKCHAGCTSEAIVAALGLGMRDLFPSTDASPRRTAKTLGEARRAEQEQQTAHEKQVRIERSNAMMQTVVKVYGDKTMERMAVELSHERWERYKVAWRLGEAERLIDQLVFLLEKSGVLERPHEILGEPLRWRDLPDRFHGEHILS